MLTHVKTICGCNIPCMRNRIGVYITPLMERHIFSVIDWYGREIVNLLIYTQVPLYIGRQDCLVQKKSFRKF
jgi:hypothetical protein